MSVVKKRINVEPVHIKLLKEGNIDISGGGDVAGTVDLKFDANIPLSLASLFSADLADADGNITILGSVTGNVNDPDIKGDLALNNISIIVPELMQRFHEINGRAFVTPQKVTIESITGKLDEGRFDCAGTVDLDSLKLSNFALYFNGYALPIHMPEMLDLLFNAKLNLHGHIDSSVIEGEIEMLEGVYYKDFKNISLISGIAQKKERYSRKRRKRKNLSSVT